MSDLKPANENKGTGELAIVDGGIAVLAGNAEASQVEAQMVVARSIMQKRQEVLRELAK